MSSRKQFKLPDVGEGLTEGEILKWYVQPGDEVVVNQTIVEIETAKAAVELPSPYAGVVSELHYPEGETVDVGSPIITIETEPSADGGSVATPESEPPAQTGAAAAADMVPQVPTPAEDEAVEPGLIGGPAPGGRTSVLVGYGPKTTSAKRRPRKSSAPAQTAEAASAGGGDVPADVSDSPDAADSPDAPDAPSNGQRAATQASDGEPQRTSGGVVVLAKPPVRKLARTLGVDLSAVRASGPEGTITRADVESAARGGSSPAEVSVAPQEEQAVESVATTADRERRIPVKGVRKMTAQAMVRSAFTAPHVSEFLTVDVTRTMRLTRRLREHPDFAGSKVSPLLLVAKALLLAVRRHPEINATFDDDAQEIVVKSYVNLGIAAATPRGLIVPNIKDADALALPQLAAAMGELVSTARAGKTSPAEMAGGTITITNVGVFGVDTGTPILNPGEAAIFAFGAVREMPWVHRGKIVPRQVTQLGLSFDHRLVDGELGSRFLADVGRILERPVDSIVF